MSKPVLSIVIVSYNTKDLIVNCIHSLEKVKEELPFEIIISDNGSTDGSIEALQKIKNKFKTFHIIENNANLGFSKGNNAARAVSQGTYILFLNPDTLIHTDTLQKSVGYLKQHSEVGALTCRVELPDGSLDPDTRRRFPTPWIALTHFSYLDRIFKGNKLFDRYWYRDYSETETHEVEALQGAYFLATKNVLDQVGWFDEDYFLDGEDIDLSFKIHKTGLKIIYYPEVKITHIKKGSKSKNRSLRSVVGGVEAMKLFYRKHMWSRYPFIINWLVILGVNAMKLLRTIKYYL